MRPAPTPSLLSALRAGTRDLHDRTEAAFVLGSTGVTRAVYADVLARLAESYARVEGTLTPWAPALAAYGLDLNDRRKTPLLWRDLAALDTACDTPSDDTPHDDTPHDDAPGDALSNATGRPTDALSAGAAPGPVLPSLAAALGTLYVHEGATLGGQLLRRRLGPALDLTPDRGLAFFSAYGADVGPMWRAFTAALDQFDADTALPARPDAHATAVAAARTAFLAFERDVVTPTALPTAPPPALPASAASASRPPAGPPARSLAAPPDRCPTAAA